MEKQKINPIKPFHEIMKMMIDDKKFIQECIGSGNTEKLKERFEMTKKGLKRKR